MEMNKVLMKRNENFMGKTKPTLGISRCFPFRRRIFFLPESEVSGIPEMGPSMPCTAYSSSKSKKTKTQKLEKKLTSIFTIAESSK